MNTKRFAMSNFVVLKLMFLDIFSLISNLASEIGKRIAKKLNTIEDFETFLYLNNHSGHCDYINYSQK